MISRNYSEKNQLYNIFSPFFTNAPGLMRYQTRLLSYLLTCTTHSFQHYSYASANYVDYVTSRYPYT